MVGLAETPRPPYYAVIFTSQQGSSLEGYDETSVEMETLAARQPGFLGLESVRGPDGLGITVSYWSSPDSIRAWKEQAEHRAAQRMGRERWYRDYRIRVCRVERDYGLSI